MLIWYLKQVQDFILKFPINGSFCVEVHKSIKCTIYHAVFFTSGGGVEDVLVRLSLIKQIIKDANLRCILFSVKHLQDSILFSAQKVLCPQWEDKCLAIFYYIF